MGADNTVEINIVELETYKKLAELYKKEHPDWKSILNPSKEIKKEEKLKDKE